MPETDPKPSIISSTVEPSSTTEDLRTQSDIRINEADRLSERRRKDVVTYLASALIFVFAFVCVVGLFSENQAMREWSRAGLFAVVGTAVGALFGQKFNT